MQHLTIYAIKVILRKQFLIVILILWVINLEIKLNEYNPWRQKQSYNLLRPIDKSTEWPYVSNSFHIMHLKVFIINQNNIPKFLLKKFEIFLILKFYVYSKKKKKDDNRNVYFEKTTFKSNFDIVSDQFRN